MAEVTHLLECARGGGAGRWHKFEALNYGDFNPVVGPNLGGQRGARFIPAVLVNRFVFRLHGLSHEALRAR